MLPLSCRSAAGEASGCGAASTISTTRPPAAQVLGAFASEAALILAHQGIAGGDEVAAAQALIEQLGLRGVLFTADALHCQKNLRLHDRDRQRAAGAREGQPASLA